MSQAVYRIIGPKFRINQRVAEKGARAGSSRQDQYNGNCLLIRANQTNHGHSGKSLYQKLGLKSGMPCLPLYPSTHYDDLALGAAGVTCLDIANQADVVHLFCINHLTLDQERKGALAYVADGGMHWVS